MADKAAEIRERALARGAAPVLSPLAVRLIDLAADENASAGQLAAIIDKDPGLAARLLRLVNSAAFRRSGEEITSITRAVVILGLREVRIMALSVSLRDTLPLKKDGPDFNLFWRTNLHRAALARATALLVAPGLAEDAFAAGLLQELGLPILLALLTPADLAGFPGIGAGLERQLAWERERLGLTHRQLGRELMTAWRLPARLAECQEPLGGDEAQDRDLLARLADFAGRATEGLFLPEGNFGEVSRLAARRFHLESERVGQMLSESLAYASQAAEALDIALDHQADLLAVMEKANAALSRLSTRVTPQLRKVMGSADRLRLKEKAMVNALEAVAHEIRNPLMSVGGFARRLAHQAEESQSVKRYAEVIVSEAARLDQVLGEILSLVTPFKPKLVPLDLTALLAGLPPPPGVGLVCHLPPGPVMVEADPQGLKEALACMLDYGGHLLPPPAAGLHLFLKEGRFRVAVNLVGPGQPPAGEEEDDALAGKSFGPELALAKARRVLEAHGGYLSVGSAPQGNGFVLTAALPPRQAPALDSTSPPA